MNKLTLSLILSGHSTAFNLLSTDEDNHQSKIINSGLRIHPHAVNLKTGASLNKPRRDARGARRVTDRRKQRLKNIRKLCIKQNLITKNEFDQLFIDKEIDLWELRSDALARKLTNSELTRVLYYLAKHRGMLESHKNEPDDEKEIKEKELILKAIKCNKDNFKKSNCKTIGEFFHKTIQTGEPMRNKRSDYSKSVSRSLVVNEAKVIFDSQSELGNPICTKKLFKEYCSIAFTQKPLQSIEHMVGYCSLELDQKRAPKNSYSFELFRAVLNINNLKLINIYGAERCLTKNEKELLFEECQKLAQLSYAQIRKKLKLDADDMFKQLRNKKETSVLIDMQGTHTLKKIIGKDTSTTLLDTIATIISYEKDLNAMEQCLLKLELKKEVVAQLLKLNFVQFGNVSIKAIQQLLPFMLEGEFYTNACILAGYNREYIKTKLLPPLPDEYKTTNPVVNRGVAEARKLTNAIIRKYGSVHQIIIMFHREFVHTMKECRQIEKEQANWQKAKIKAKEECLQHGVEPTNKNLLKFRLWKQQSEYCLYTQTKIKVEDLIKAEHYEVGHILPPSRCLDDSLNNKVLVSVKENQEKHNKTPYEYFTPKKWEKFCKFLTQLDLPEAKYFRLIKTTLIEIDDYIKDNGYIARLMKDYIEKYLQFEPWKELKQTVQVRAEKTTKFLNWHWNTRELRLSYRTDMIAEFTLENENNKIKNAIAEEKGQSTRIPILTPEQIIEKSLTKRHIRDQILDAILISCSTQTMITYFAQVLKLQEINPEGANRLPKIPLPWNTFIEDCSKAIQDVFITRTVTKKISGTAHDATVKSKKRFGDNEVTYKVPLERVTFKILAKIVDKEYNQALYDVLYNRLVEFGGDPKKAFKEPIYKPLSAKKAKLGIKPTIIRGIKVVDKQTSGVFVQNGIARNGNLVKVNIFEKANKFFLSPVYNHQIAKKIIPNKVISGKTEADWLIIDDSYKFKFSLFPNELIRIQKGDDIVTGYYLSTDRATASINIETHDKSIIYRKGIKNLNSIKKFNTDHFGNWSEVLREPLV